MLSFEGGSVCWESERGGVKSEGWGCGVREVLVRKEVMEGEVGIGVGC